VRKPILFTLLALATLPCPASAAATLLMTAPEQPVAGQATTLVFTAPSMRYDLDPATPPAVSVDGSTVRIDLNVVCEEIFCELVQALPMRMQLPALPQGAYVVQVHANGMSQAPIGEMQLDVAAATAIEKIRPAEGFWTDPSRPGTGLYLQHRGDLVAVAQFEYVAGLAVWRLDTAPLQGTSLAVVLREFSDGSCFACEDHVVPRVTTGGTPMSLHFQSARRAHVELQDGSLLQMVSLPFGAAYVDSLFEDRADLSFSPLPLPDLRGKWAIGGPFNLVVELGAATTVAGDVIRFSTAADAPASVQILCTPGNPTRAGQCELRGPGAQTGTPPPGSIPLAPLGNIEENRIRFVAHGSAFYAVRLPTAN
jgi:hypothetical protein